MPRDAKAGDYALAGFIGFQTCREDTGCDFPQAAKFQVTLPVDARQRAVGGQIPLDFAPAKSYKQVADLRLAVRYQRVIWPAIRCSKFEPVTGWQPGQRSQAVNRSLFMLAVSDSLERTDSESACHACCP